MNVWFCCANVEFDHNNEWFPGYSGAFVNVMTQSVDGDDLIHKVHQAMLDLNFNLISCDEVQIFSDKIKIDHPIKELFKLYEQAKISSQVYFGTFHTYTDS